MPTNVQLHKGNIVCITNDFCCSENFALYVIWKIERRVLPSRNLCRQKVHQNMNHISPMNARDITVLTMVILTLVLEKSNEIWRSQRRSHIGLWNQLDIIHMTWLWFKRYLTRYDRLDKILQLGFGKNRDLIWLSQFRSL